MRERELKRLVLSNGALTWIQRGDLIDRLRAIQAGQEARPAGSVTRGPQDAGRANAPAHRAAGTGPRGPAAAVALFQFG